MKLKIFDSNKKELQLNDLVIIQDKRNDDLTFIAKVQIINGQIFPFNKFSFDRILFCENIPENYKYAEKTDLMPEYWINPKIELKLDQLEAFETFYYLLLL